MKNPGPSLSAPLFGGPFAVFSPSRLKSFAVVAFFCLAFVVGSVYAKPVQQPVHQVPPTVQKLTQHARVILTNVSNTLLKGVESFSQKLPGRPFRRPVNENKDYQKAHSA